MPGTRRIGPKLTDLNFLGVELYIYIYIYICICYIILYIPGVEQNIRSVLPGWNRISVPAAGGVALGRSRVVSLHGQSECPGGGTLQCSVCYHLKGLLTVSSHNFDSQSLSLRVSTPRTQLRPTCLLTWPLLTLLESHFPANSLWT